MPDEPTVSGGEQLDPGGAARAVHAAMAGLPGLAVLVFDLDLRVLAVYGGGLAKHGYEADRIIGRRIFEFTPAAAWSRVGPLYERALAGATFTGEHTSHDGTAIYESTFAPVREGGAIVAGTMVAREVTALRSAQREVAETARRFQALAETAVEGHCRYSPEGVILWASPSMQTLTGRAMEDLIGSRAQDSIHPEDLARRDAAFADMLRTRTPTTIELRAKHADGTWHWFESTVRGWFADDGALLEVHVTTRDITRRRADDELRRQWQLTFDSSSRGISLTDQETDAIVSVNPSFAAMHGGRPADFVDRPLAAVFSAESAIRIPTVAEILDCGGHLRYQSVHVRLDGTSFPVDTEVVAARAEDGRVLYRVGFHTDLSEQHEREASERRAVALFTTAVEKAPIGMCLVATDGRFLRVNAALCRLLERDEETLLTSDFQTVTHPEDLDLDLDLMTETLAGVRDGYEIAKRYVTPAGEVIHARLSVGLIRHPNGEPAHFVSQVVDLTERHRHEDQLQASLQITRQMLTHEPGDALTLIADEARRIALADTAVIMVPEPGRAGLLVTAAAGAGAEALEGRVLPAAGSHADDAIRTGRPVLIADAQAFPDSPVMRALADTVRIGPAMLVPLLGEGGARGALALGRVVGRAAFGTADADLVAVFANHAALALEVADARAAQQQLTTLADRDRIARDLHDHVIQRLFATGLTLQALGADPNREGRAERLNQAITYLDETITEIRTVIYGLRGPVDARGPSFREHLLDLVSELTPLLPTTPKVRLAGPIDSLVTDAVSADALAVLREALTNVARHAHATGVEIDLTVGADDHRMVLDVADDGVGMGDTERRSGLADLRKRAEVHGGSLTITPAHGGPTPRGTRLRWSVPLP